MRRLVALVTALTIFASIATVWPSYGAVPALDRIRVAIFLQLPGKYQLNTAGATLSAASGLDIGLREPSGITRLLTASPGESARFTLDDYKVKLLETADLNAALAAFKRLQTASGAGFITSLTKSGKLVYQVTEGSYATAADAKAALDKWSKDTALAGLLGSSKPSIAGPHRLETPPYATLEEAQQAALAFGEAGIDAFAAIKPPVSEGQAVTYTAQVGASADEAGLALLKAAASKVPAGSALTALRTSEPYLLIRDDHSLSQSKTAGKQYSLPMTGSAKVWVSAVGDEGIKLAERYNRTYRGSFELTGFNKKLAVVNELPFEHYLYAVVGAEMPASWPAEALKAQAVAARSYALYQGFGFQIAHVVDSTLSQAYGGIGSEKPATIAAVDATAGEVVLHEGRVVEALFSSSAGGASANPSEIWGTSVPYLGSVPSPDQLSEKGLYAWYRVVLPDSRVGYIREDLLVPAGQKSVTGNEIMLVKGDGVAVRPIPLIQSEVEPVARANDNTRVVVLEKTVQSNEMSWVRGPFSPETLAASIKGKPTTPISEPVRTVEVGIRGESGRVTELLVNGSKLTVRSPDSLRSALGGLPSTRFDIDETGRLSVLSTGGLVREKPADSAPVYAVGADGQSRKLDAPAYFVLNGNGDIRAATPEPAFRFTGTGYGHGVGLSQWGARGLAEQGYDYQSILQYYYKNVTVEKE
jgi:stage II sporulation protein D